MGVTTTSDGRTILHNISWETYECLLKNYENQSSVRLTYDEGDLEIMSPLIQHEVDNRALGDIVTLILDTWEWDFVNAGSTTFRKESAGKGFEPDTCFYIADPDKVRGKRDIDVAAGDPPPDLVIEIDLTSSSLPRLPIYAALGVPEVWRYENGLLTILVLTDEGYAERTESAVLPNVLAAQVNLWLAGLATTKRAAWAKGIRQWAESHPPDANARS